ncbi:unnamed protein product [Arctia plantaginis]|uniref:RNA-directed DNA polymerase n=1 Tax=Arctia plantaginis TaxID=874455 RepID=A0A8S1AAU8_ARCPL|nr:unnamed protein product [Arctia plantaginis]
MDGDKTRGQGYTDDVRGQGLNSHDVRGQGLVDGTRGQGYTDDVRGQGLNSHDIRGQGLVTDGTRGQGYTDDVRGQGLDSHDVRGQGLVTDGTRGQGYINDVRGQGLIGHDVRGQGLVIEGTRGQGYANDDVRGQGLMIEGTRGHRSLSKETRSQRFEGDETSYPQQRGRSSKRRRKRKNKYSSTSSDSSGESIRTHSKSKRLKSHKDSTNVILDKVLSILGHPSFKCDKPLVKCTKCDRMGHQSANCYTKPDNPTNKSQNEKQVSELSKNDKSNRTNHKYIMDIKVNDVVLECHLDLGSQCSLIRYTNAKSLRLAIVTNVELPVLRGIGANLIQPLGLVSTIVQVQGIVESVDMYVVEDYVLRHPILLGHSFTEKPQIVITKTPDRIIFHKIPCSKKIHLFCRDDTSIPIEGLRAVPVINNTLEKGTVYVDGSIRGPDTQKYYLLPGEYSIENNICALLIHNMSKSTINIEKGSLLTRAMHIRNTLNAHEVTISTTEIDDSVNCNPNFTAEERLSLQNVLSDFKDCFSSNLKDLGLTNATEMTIDLADSTPVVYRPYRMARSERQLVQEMVQEMIDSDFLGFEVSAAGIRPGLKKTEAVHKFPKPKNQHELRQFLGLSGFFRRFIKDYAIIASPLTDLLKKDQKWAWRVPHETAFTLLKNLLSSRPLLSLYNPLAETQLHTDASKHGLAGILLQRNPDGALQPVSYFSRKTTAEEQKYHSFELETLAVIASLNRFRVYLIGIAFTIHTDCSAIRSTLTKRDLVPRIARWWIQLQEFDCAIEYRPGNKMSHVDALSRNPIDSEPNESHILDILLVESEQDWVTTIQSTDEDITRIREILSNPNSGNVVDICKNFKLKHGRVYRVVGDEIKWVVPKGARWQILKRNHDDVGHYGYEKTLERIRQHYWFGKMRRFVKKYVSACLECAHHKAPGGKREGALHPIEKISVPFHTIHADHLGPFVRSKLGNCYLLVIIDSFTKFINITAVKNTKSLTTIKVFRDHIRFFGVPTRLITDRGSSFTSKSFKEFTEEYGIKHVLNAVATPRANGQVERFNRTITEALATSNHGKDERRWDESIIDVQIGLNTTVHKTTRKSPSELLFGFNINHRAQGILSTIINETINVIPSDELNTIRDEASKRSTTKKRC